MVAKPRPKPRCGQPAGRSFDEKNVSQPYSQSHERSPEERRPQIFVKALPSPPRSQAVYRGLVVVSRRVVLFQPKVPVLLDRDLAALASVGGERESVPKQIHPQHFRWDRHPALRESLGRRNMALLRQHRYPSLLDRIRSWLDLTHNPSRGRCISSLSYHLGQFSPKRKVKGALPGQGSGKCYFFVLCRYVSCHWDRVAVQSSEHLALQIFADTLFHIVLSRSCPRRRVRQ